MEYTSRSIVVVMRFEHFLFIVLQIYRHYCSRVVVFRRPFCYSEGRCVSWRRGVDERILETDLVGNLAEAPGKSGQEENGRATSRVNSAPIRRANVFSLSDFTATVADFKRELRQRGSCTKSIYTDFARGTRQETRSSRISNEDRNELRNWRKRVLAKGSPIRGSHPRNSIRYLIYVRIKFSFYFYWFRQREVSSHNFSEISSIIEESRKNLDFLEPKKVFPLFGVRIHGILRNVHAFIRNFLLFIFYFLESLFHILRNLINEALSIKIINPLFPKRELRYWIKLLE